MSLVKLDNATHSPSLFPLSIEGHVYLARRDVYKARGFWPTAKAWWKGDVSKTMAYAYEQLSKVRVKLAVRPVAMYNSSTADPASGTMF